jgi:hypothetical protein
MANRLEKERWEFVPFKWLSTVACFGASAPHAQSAL